MQFKVIFSITSLKTKHILIAILILAAVFRLVNLSAGDPLTDEVLYSFRAVGPMDYDESDVQTTPWEWLDPDATLKGENLPFWTNLSFHDHPPLVFWTQHFSMLVFGETNFGFRLPSALLGIASVYLVFLIGTALYSKRSGLISSALAAVTINSVYISRIGLQEAYVIFFLLLIFYFFLRALKADLSHPSGAKAGKYLLWAGLVFGLGLLAKYTTAIAVPVIITYLAIFRRDLFLNKNFWLGGLLSLLIFSPVIIYNAMLYKTIGHFDFQIFYILGQESEVWKVFPGKEIGTLANRAIRFVPALVDAHSWVMLLALAGVFVAFLVSLFGSAKENFKKHSFLIFVFFWITLLLLKIGPSLRFVSMYGPFFALAVGEFFSSAYNKLVAVHKIKILALILFSLFLVWESFYSVNSQITYYPVGPEPWAYAFIREENYNWGYNELSEFLDGEMRGRFPGLTFDMKYSFLEDIRNENIAKYRRSGLERYPALFIYDDNIHTFSRLWILDRKTIYHSWPVIDLEAYFNIQKENGFDFFDRTGFKTFYFIKTTENIPLKREGRTDLAEKLEKALKGQGKRPYEVIKNKRGEPVFRVYKF